MSWVCNKHGWSSFSQMCPACQNFTTTTGTTANDGYFQQEVKQFVPRETVIQPTWERLAVNKENIKYLCESLESYEKKFKRAKQALKDIMNIIPKDFTNREMLIDQIIINAFKDFENENK